MCVFVSCQKAETWGHKKHQRNDTCIFPQPTPTDTLNFQPHCISSTVPPPTISSSHQKNTRLYFALSLRVKKLLQRKKRSFNSNVAFDVDDSVLRININHVVG